MTLINKSQALIINELGHKTLTFLNNFLNTCIEIQEMSLTNPKKGEVHKRNCLCIYPTQLNYRWGGIPRIQRKAASVV